MKVLTNSQKEKVAWLLQPFAIPCRSTLWEAVYGETTTGCSGPCADFGVGWGGGEREKGNGSLEDFGHFANMTLQGGICNYILGKKGSGSTVPKLWLKQSTWAGCGDVSRRARTKSIEEFKPDDDNHPGQS